MVKMPRNAGTKKPDTKQALLNRVNFYPRALLIKTFPLSVGDTIQRRVYLPGGRVSTGLDAEKFGSIHRTAVTAVSWAKCPGPSS